MTTNAVRADILARALRASIEGDTSVIAELSTEDVVAWTPGFFAASRGELEAAIKNRDNVFSAIEVEVVPLDVGGDFACVEWRVEMTHSATETRVTLHGVTVAEFRDDRICSVRQYWNELALIEQLDASADA